MRAFRRMRSRGRVPLTPSLDTGDRRLRANSASPLGKMSSAAVSSTENGTGSVDVVAFAIELPIDYGSVLLRIYTVGICTIGVLPIDSTL